MALHQVNYDWYRLIEIRRGAEKISSGRDWSFRNNLDNFDDSSPFRFFCFLFFLRTLKTAAFRRKVSQISNLMIFKRKK